MTPSASLLTDQGIMTRRHSIQTPDVTQSLPGQTTEGKNASPQGAGADYQATPDAILYGSASFAGNDSAAKVSHYLEKQCQVVFNVVYLLKPLAIKCGSLKISDYLFDML